ncbi:ROK family protein [Rhizobium leguminosarum]|uniref:ROK family protein n=1 Tax=Rhizobium ruizarguesonis TaxID=2081791 RepID=A0AAE4YMW6_9HYPH|nr:ROK family transcriptional regulator [Rhizobium ruizarguesonis]NEI48006.1 ROK family protein [Rhizobium ruizarguesonis]
MALKVDQGTAKALNRRLALNLLRREGGLSRGELAAKTGLSNAAITGLVSELIEEGFLKEGESTQSTGGRKPVLVELDYAARYSIGLKLMSDRLEAVLTDLSTEPLAATVIALSDVEPETVAEASRQAVQQLIPDSNLRSEKLIGVGLAMPGLIDVEHGVCRVSHRFGWHNIPIASLLAEQVHVPVWVDNDVNAFAIAQQLFGAARRRSSALVLIIGTGVGSALIFHGQIHRGARFAAGEIGFAVDGGGVKPDALSNWGHRFAEPAIERQWVELCATSVGRKPVRLQEAAESGDPQAVELLGSIGRDIGIRLVGMIDLVDPEVVIVGGEAIRFGKALIDPMIEAVKQYSFEVPPPIEIDWENNIWSRGASALAIQKFFDFESADGVALS